MVLGKHAASTELGSCLPVRRPAFPRLRFVHHSPWVTACKRGFLRKEVSFLFLLGVQLAENTFVPAGSGGEYLAAPTAGPGLRSGSEGPGFPGMDAFSLRAGRNRSSC